MNGPTGIARSFVACSRIGTWQFSAEMFVNQVDDFISGSGPFRLGVPVLFRCGSYGTSRKVACPKRFELLTHRFVVWCLLGQQGPETHRGLVDR